MKIQSNYEGCWNDICAFCGEPQENHKVDNGVYNGTHYIHRMTCKPERSVIIKNKQREVRLIKGLILFGWILVPLFIATVGFANFSVGLLLFIISLIKIAIEYVKFFGNPEKWIPGFKEKEDKERKMKHYFYHCEKNPDGFRKLFIDNLSDEDENNV